MSKKELTLLIGMTATVFGLIVADPTTAMAQAVQRGSASPQISKGLTAIDTAARSGKYLFMFFWKENDEQTQAMHGVLQSTMGKVAKSADSVTIRVNDPNEKVVVDKYGVSRAPMPLVLALAPNGAITQGFPTKFTENDLRQGFVSAGTSRCLKALQDRKFVLLCVQNQRTQFNQAALQGVRDYKADTRFASSTEIVTLDPTDQKEAGFLNSLKVNPATQTAVTVVLSPPGSSVAQFSGPVSKDQIVAKIASSKSSCCPGGKCGPQ